MNDSLIRSNERVRELGEVFTPNHIVKDMHNLFSAETWADTTFGYLEPTCGNGNFIVEAIKMKLAHGLTIEQAVNTTWGMDVMKDNIDDCHNRIFQIIAEEYKYIGEYPDVWLTNVARAIAIVRNNIFAVNLETGGSLTWLESGEFAKVKYFHYDPLKNTPFKTGCLLSSERQPILQKIKNEIKKNKISFLSEIYNNQLDFWR